MSPNGSHQRPHADLTARGRVALNRALGPAARGRALYASRRAACVCYATGLGASSLRSRPGKTKTLVGSRDSDDPIWVLSNAESLLVQHSDKGIEETFRR